MRVLGQLMVVLYAPDFLPPMNQWYSGLMPYKYLLPVQFFIIVQFGRIAYEISRGEGYWAQRKERMGKWLQNFGVFYFVAIIARGVILGISIPVIFHWVLALFLIVLGRYHLQTESKN
jgi:hypothetical protein